MSGALSQCTAGDGREASASETLIDILEWNLDNNMSQTSFGDLLNILKTNHPRTFADLPASFKETMSRYKDFDLPFHVVDVCPGDEAQKKPGGCVLFEGEYATLDHCPKCNACRWEEDGMADERAAGAVNDDGPAVMEGTKKKTKKKAKPKKAKCRFYHWRIEDLLCRVYSNPTTAGLMRSHGTRRTPGTTEMFDIPGTSQEYV